MAIKQKWCVRFKTTAAGKRCAKFDNKKQRTDKFCKKFKANTTARKKCEKVYEE